MKNKIVNNTVMLMIFNISKIIFPFVTLPYLTRILTTESYGSVTYVKNVMTYMQILVDFGFILSATKDVVKVKNDKEKMEYVVGDTLLARTILGLIGFIIVGILCFTLPILKENILYTILSYVVVFESIFLMDYLFRGIEKMGVITVRFILMKTISTVLTFMLIKNDSDLLLIPILDIASSFVAIILVFYEMYKLKIKMHCSNITNAFKNIASSFVYFISNVASTSFNALSTIIIGIYLTKTDVAYWGICMQIIGTIQACYNPISDGIYPEMIRSKNIGLVKKVLKIFMPIVFLGCIFSYFVAPKVLLILGGNEYLNALTIFRILIPCLFFGFISVILGWPTLGAIGKTKETTKTSMLSVIIYIVEIILLIKTKHFTLINIAIARASADVLLFVSRYFYYRKYKDLFNEAKGV